MSEQSTGGDFWGGLSDRFFTYLDYSINDAMGLNQPQYQPVYYPYPEQIPPSASNPVEPGFTFGNNTGTWAIGLGVLAVGFLLVKVIK